MSAGIISLGMSKLAGDLTACWSTQLVWEKLVGIYLSVLVLLDDVPFSVRVEVQPTTAPDVILPLNRWRRGSKPLTVR